MTLSKARKIFDRLWEDYLTLNPDVKRVYNLFKSEGENIVNDHIAFRTYDDPRVNIDVLAKPFFDAGYEYRGEYHFKEKHLYALHFEFASFLDAPRVFISQLKIKEFSSDLQKIVKSVIDAIPSHLYYSEKLVLSGRTWGKPSWETYLKLLEESEYAAWVYVFGYRANHFTVNVNALKNFDSIEAVNSFLKDKGFLMNDTGGEVKGSKEELLQQSSIKSGIVDVEFREGKHSVPSCYYEFAKRYLDQNGKLYLGFIAKSADKIFESTDYYEKNNGKSS